MIAADSKSHNCAGGIISRKFHEANKLHDSCGFPMHAVRDAINEDFLFNAFEWFLDRRFGPIEEMNFYKGPLHIKGT